MVKQSQPIQRGMFLSGIEKLLGLFFATPRAPVSLIGVVGWWEARRIPFNMMIGAYGFACVCIFMWAITTSGQLEPGEDAVDAVAVMAAPIAVNLLYTLGWLVEVPARIVVPGLSARFGPCLLIVGIALAVALITLPAALWTAFRVLQWVGMAA
jgi:hypothetical protein